MRKLFLFFLNALIIMLNVNQIVTAQNRTFTTIEIPDSDSTTCYGINNNGDIVGSFGSSTAGNGAQQGFVRISDGTSNTIAFSEATVGSDTVCYGINDNGDIVGRFGTQSTTRGFLRISDGTLNTIIFPDSDSTVCYGINNNGDIVGSFRSSTAGNGEQQGFVRISDGTFNTIEFSEATVGSDTVCYGINDNGDIVGRFGTQSTTRGFLRISDGTLNTIVFPDSDSTVCYGINNNGDIVGSFRSSTAGNGEQQGFVRISDGTFNTIAFSEATVGSDTVCYGINDNGDIVGRFGTQSTTRGFLATLNPTAVELISFTATAFGEEVLLEWETATEIDNAGFNIYRAKYKRGPYIKVNNELIEAKGDSVSGATYSYIDILERTGRYFYNLEDIDTNGKSTMHGSIRVRVSVSE